MRTNLRTLAFAIALLAAGVSCPVLAQEAEVPPPRETVKLLTIGNSFARDALQYLPDFARAGGKIVQVFSANPSGYTLKAHASSVDAFENDPADPRGRPYKNHAHPKTGEMKDFSLKEALEADDWDYVTIQQLSGLSFKPESYEPHAGRLIAYIREHSPGSEILIHQTWAWREDAPEYRDGFTIEEMHAGTVAAYGQLAERYRLRVIPVGEAFHAARQSPLWKFQFPDPDYDYERPPAGKLPTQPGSLSRGWFQNKSGGLVLDPKHSNNAGKYLAGAVFYEVLFNEPVPDEAGGFVRGTPEQAADLRRIAHETVRARPFAD
jgi:hypothetical protein